SVLLRHALLQRYVGPVSGLHPPHRPDERGAGRPALPGGGLDQPDLQDRQRRAVKPRKGGTPALDEHKMVVRWLALLIAAAAVVLALYTLRLIFLQLVHGEEFAARATSTTEYRFNVTAARGDILDNAGRRIATST